MVTAAYPFIEVKIDTKGLTPTAQRAPGVIAVVGKTESDEEILKIEKPEGISDPEFKALSKKLREQIAEANKPIRVDTLDDIKQFKKQVVTLAQKGDPKKWVVDKITFEETDLSRSLSIGFLQDPKPSKIYGVRVVKEKDKAGKDTTNIDDYTSALSALESADDVTFVSLANETDVGNASSAASEGKDAKPATNLHALKEHVELMSAQGQKRIGVAMVDPKTTKTSSYVEDIKKKVDSLKSSSSRMVMIAARGATGDAATAAMAAIAGYKPHISTVLKKIRGFKMPLESQYSPSEIRALSEANIIPIIDPDLIVGESLHFAEGRCFTSDADLLYIDIVRTLDDIDFKLKAGLIGLVGDARITKMGMTRLKTSTESILGVLKRQQVIANFVVDIPVLNILNIPESARNATDNRMVADARANRTVKMYVDVTYGPAVHRLLVTLAPKF
ncbi:hypothetical protein N836_24185 [Leptolyngbya sp. Heron Island J]|uniref:hypothetical protein n=1 Tax=Leptolyngbya sp. Heron Island J TaxID=1385935 RepID=UPI0003B9A7C3|nr:hypothetical protein [Leptolyngbya sp. Heron Island J]ESA32890.1 hypothetical protein N836_24185 [Leptolyngbya sp. Heron Island J]